MRAAFELLRDIVVDAVQAAYYAIEPIIGRLVLVVAAALNAGPALTTVAEITALLLQAGVARYFPSPREQPLAAAA